MEWYIICYAMVPSSLCNTWELARQQFLFGELTPQTRSPAATPQESSHDPPKRVQLHGIFSRVLPPGIKKNLILLHGPAPGKIKKFHTTSPPPRKIKKIPYYFTVPRGSTTSRIFPPAARNKKKSILLHKQLHCKTSNSILFHHGILQIPWFPTRTSMIFEAAASQE